MYPAQVSNVCQQALPPPPPTSVFLNALKEAMAPRESPAADVGLYGDRFSGDPSLEPQVKHNEATAFAAACDFEKVCVSKQVSLEKMDDWMAAFAKFVLSPRYLLDSADDQNQCMVERLALCERAGVQSRQWTPPTLKTNMNALSSLFKTTGSPYAVVPSVPARFPMYVAVFNAAEKRHKIEEAQREENKVVQDSEVAMLSDKTNVASWYEVQRTNLLLLTFALGQRSDSILKLDIGNFQLKVDEKGTEFLSVRFGPMKNMQANQENVGKGPHTQDILPHPDPRLCAVAAYRRQLAMLPDPSNRAAPFWLGVRPYQKQPLKNAKRATYSTAQGTVFLACEIRWRPSFGVGLKRHEILPNS